MQSAWIKSIWVTIISIVGSVLTTSVMCVLADMSDWLFSISVAILCPLLLAPPVAYVCFRQNDRVQFLLTELEIAHEALSEQVRRDALTGLLSRSAFIAECEKAVQDNSRNALLLLDADDFKSINDRFGHISGDTALMAIAAVMKDVVREGGIAGRIGGEEFAVLLPNATAELVLQKAEEIRLGVETRDVLAADETRMPLTVSVGAVLGWSHASFIELYSEADARLYDAKRNGRNQVVSQVKVALAAA